MILFYFREVFKSIKRAKLSFALSLITTCISVILVVASIALIKSSNALERSIKDKIVINLFLSPSDSMQTHEAFLGRLKALGYFSEIKYLDKEEAYEKFIQETGEDFRKVLDYNPLPASVEVVLKQEYIEKNTIRRIASELKQLGGVEDVVFQSEAAFKLLDILLSLRVYVFAASIFLIIVSFYIVYSTNKLIIESRRIEMETMKLVGAKKATIRLPIILNGVLIGLTASLLSFLIIRVIIMLFDNSLRLSIANSDFCIFYTVIFTSGPIIGFFASLFSVKKIALRLS